MKKTLLSFFACLFVMALIAQKPQLLPPINHIASIKTISVSPDGQYVITGAEYPDNVALLWTADGWLLKILAGHQSGIADAGFSATGKFIYTLEANGGPLHLWNNLGEEINKISGQNIHDACFSPNEQNLFLGGEKLQLLDLKGKIIQDFPTGESPILSVDFSLNGQFIAAADSAGIVRVFDVKGNIIKTLDGHDQKPVNAIKFSPDPDGQLILSGGTDNRAIIWHWKDGKMVKKTGPFPSSVSTVAFSPNGTLLAAGSIGGNIYLFNNLGKAIKTLKKEYNIHQVVFDPIDDAILIARDDNAAYKLDLKDGTEIVFYYNDASPVSSVDFSKTATDSPNFVTGGEAQHIRLWSTTFDEATFYLNDDTTFYLNDDTYTPVIFNAQYDSLLIARSGDHIYSFDQPIQQLDEIGPVKNSSHPAIAGNLEGNAFLISDFSGGVALWEETNGVDGWEQKWEEKIKSNFVTSLAFAPNGQYFLTATNRENTNPFGNYLIGEDQPDDARGFPAALRKVDDFSVVRTFGVSADQAIFSKDGKWVATNDESGLSVFNYKDAKLLFHVGINAPNAPMVICLAFAPNNLSIVAGYSNNVLQQFDLKGKLIREYKGHLGAIRSLAFSPNGKFLLSGSNDNSAKLWDVEKGSELATLMAIGKKDWLLSTPNGLFDASSGAMEQFYYVVGLEIISLDQLKDQYFEPGLLSKILLNEPTRKVENLENSVQAAFPKLLKSALINNVINVKTQARSGGIGKATISVDGNQEIIEDANPKRLENFSVNLLAYAKYFIPGEKNMLTLEIYSADGWSHSRSDTLYYTPAGPSGKGKPDKPKSNTTVSSLNDDTDKDLVNTLYALIVGTSDYKGETLDLKFPDLDAAAFADMVQKSGEELFGSDRVQVKMLSTAKKSTPPTKKAIRDALVNIAAKAEPKDILLVYFSGHGVTWPEKDPSSQFYYLSSDNSSFDFTNVANRQNAISQDSLQAWIRTVKARKRILILDACNSGDVIEKMDAGAKGNLSTDQRRALQRMQDRTGFFVLAGSSADKLSYEDPRFGHGLLTYSLLRNMPLVAAADKSNYVDINKLFQVVSEDVPKLAAAIQKNQEPKVIGREDFSIGIIKDVSKYKLPDAKKIITRSTFFNDKLRDPLKLSDVVNGQLETKLSDFTSAFIFYDTDKANSLYYSLNGKYEVNGTNVKATVYFYKGDQETELKTFTASGDTTQVKKLAEDLINQLYNFLATLK